MTATVVGVLAAVVAGVSVAAGSRGVAGPWTATTDRVPDTCPRSPWPVAGTDWVGPTRTDHRAGSASSCVWTLPSDPPRSQVTLLAAVEAHHGSPRRSDITAAISAHRWERERAFAEVGLTTAVDGLGDDAFRAANDQVVSVQFRVANVTVTVKVQVWTGPLAQPWANTLAETVAARAAVEARPS
jgi:hypothetical protein